jgi:penicillin-binding protein 1A
LLPNRPEHDGPARHAHASPRGRDRRRTAERRTAERRALLGVAFFSVALFLSRVAWLVHHVYFDRSGVPDLDSFIRFEPATTGVVQDVHGNALIELAREYRRIVTYDEVPLILRQAMLAAEDKSFFAHSGVDYHALPRVAQRTAIDR